MSSITDTKHNGNGYNSLLINVAKYGVGPVIALILVYQMSEELPKIKDSIFQVEAKVEKVESKLESVISQHDDMKMNNVTNQKLLRSICLILAETQTEKQLCN